MPLKIVRNNIALMETEAIVNTANPKVAVGTGCDKAVYEAAGFEELLNYRRMNIGEVSEGDVFITPGFNLKAKYIIHAVSPFANPDDEQFENKLRGCFNKSLNLAWENGIKSIAFPLISTGSFKFSKEEGMRIAVDEINAFLLTHTMEIFLVVFDSESAGLGHKYFPKLEDYIDSHLYDSMSNSFMAEASMPRSAPSMPSCASPMMMSSFDEGKPKATRQSSKKREVKVPKIFKRENKVLGSKSDSDGVMPEESMPLVSPFDEEKESKLDERIRHISDSFSQYLLYMIEDKGMENQEVYKRAIVDKKTFSKIKNNRDYHPTKLTALCLCIGAKLNLDETRDLLARAGYALSPCDKTDIIFSFFIENQIYDMVELDIQLEEHGLPCVIN
ncbi:MAG: macro domain-containing protein [Clostridia bacterium]|nr:macro domain-containing protein [Clostridia bacterium]